MSAYAPPVGLSEQDFDIIEDAVMETARGRWFLREYARRMRAADTNRLLDAMARLERIVAGQTPDHGSDSRMAYFIDALEARRESLVHLAGSLREQGYDGDLCGRIAREAQSLADLAEQMRGEAPSRDADASTMSTLAEPWPAREDPHASAPVTIDAEVLSEAEPAADHTLMDIELSQLAASQDPDLSVFAPIEALPFKDKLALFS
jgi:hypothetical protein